MKIYCRVVQSESDADIKYNVVVLTHNNKIVHDDCKCTCADYVFRRQPLNGRDRYSSLPSFLLIRPDCANISKAS